MTEKLDFFPALKANLWKEEMKPIPYGMQIAIKSKVNPVLSSPYLCQ